MSSNCWSPDFWGAPSWKNPLILSSKKSTILSMYYCDPSGYLCIFGLGVSWAKKHLGPRFVSLKGKNWCKSWSKDTKMLGGPKMCATWMSCWNWASMPIASIYAMFTCTYSYVYTVIYIFIYYKKSAIQKHTIHEWYGDNKIAWPGVMLRLSRRAFNTAPQM